MTAEAARLAGYVHAWKGAVDDVVTLLRSLPEDQWATPTDLPGWDVRAVASHLAHLESELSGAEQDHVDVPELEHVRSRMGAFTERGPLARASWTTAQIVDELERSAQERFAALRQHPPDTGSGKPPISPGGLGWDWETLLGNRCLDVWMHGQDIRRAVGRPGAMQGPAAAHTLLVLTTAIPYVVGKRVSPPPGTTLVLHVTGVDPIHLVVEVNDEGRGHISTNEPETPTVALRMDVETFVILGGGRRSPEQVEVEIVGDEELGGRVLAGMAITP